MSEGLVYESERRAMIERQLRQRGIRDEHVLEAMFQVPRHEFVPSALIGAAYADRPLPIGAAETVSQPYIVAAMTEAAGVRLGDQALEIGTGSGYQAAILAHLGARVFTVERNAGLAEAARKRLAQLGYSGIEVLVGDGSEGYPPAAPYDIVLGTAAVPRIPEVLLDQLADGGRMVVPVGGLQNQDLLLVSKRGNEVTQRLLDLCQFVPMIGRYAWPEQS